MDKNKSIWINLVPSTQKMDDIKVEDNQIKHCPIHLISVFKILVNVNENKSLFFPKEKSENS